MVWFETQMGWLLAWELQLCFAVQSGSCARWWVDTAGMSGVKMDVSGGGGEREGKVQTMKCSPAEGDIVQFVQS